MYKVGFIGSGRMAGALVNGILKQEAFLPHDIACIGGNDDTAEILARETGIHTIDTIPRLLAESEIIVLAFKPHHLDTLEPGTAELAGGKCVLSILAGIPIQKIFHHFSNASNIVRAMPNIPASIGEGVTGYSCWKALEGKDTRVVSHILKAVGPAIEVSESQLDAVTGISGSGVAFVFQFMKALRDGGIRQGLPEDKAFSFMLQTLYGAARLVEASDQSLEALIDQVVTPGGTTAAGLNALELNDFEETVKSAVTAAAERSRELSRSGD
jgi:pyrroline-5-carboxylate reductase